MTSLSETNAHILASEKRLLHSMLRHDRTFLESVLADDFVEFGKSGRRYDKTTTIAALLEEGGADRVSTQSLEMDNIQLLDLAEDVVLLTYALNSSEKQTGPIPTLRSSIWRRSNLNWQLVFHQGTPTATT